MTQRDLLTTIAMSGLLALAGCGQVDAPSSNSAAANASEPAGDASSKSLSPQDSAQQAQPADAFMAAVARHCWQSFAGRIVANEPAEADDPFAGKPLIMHVRECGETDIRIPFHVGDDRSRTWVLTRTQDGVRLKHDHRHADGTADALTMYGGDSTGEGTHFRQAFPADAESIALFESQNRAVSVTNIWAMEVQPSERFVYELSRPGRLFRVEFDLSQPVETPPDPWGSESTQAESDKHVDREK